MQIFIAQNHVLSNSSRSLPRTATGDYLEDKFMMSWLYVWLWLTFPFLTPFFTHLFHSGWLYSTQYTLLLILSRVGTEWVEMKISSTSVCLASLHSQAVFPILAFQGQFCPPGSSWGWMDFHGTGACRADNWRKQRENEILLSWPSGQTKAIQCQIKDVSQVRLHGLLFDGKPARNALNPERFSYGLSVCILVLFL